MQNKALIDSLREDQEAIKDRWAAHWEAAALADSDGDEAARQMHGLMLDFLSQMGKVVVGVIDIAEHQG